MEGVRLRLVFDDRQLLTKSQKNEGLKRSWILLQPNHHTISDLSDYILHVFDLDEACPNGLVLSIEGFALPPFESTCILKEEDVISIKKKRGLSTDIQRVRDGEKSLVVEEVMVKQPLRTGGMKLLANEEFERESGGYRSEAEEDEPDMLEDKLPVDDTPKKKAVSKKRKASKKLKRSNDRRKRHKLVNVEDVPSDVQPEENESSQQDSLPEKSPVKKDKSSDMDSESDDSSTQKIDEKADSIMEFTPSKPSSCQAQPLENGKQSVASSHTLNGVQKLPSRSTRRKRAKRQRLREQAKARENELHQAQVLKADNQQTSSLQSHQAQVHQTNNQQSSSKDNGRNSKEHQREKCNDEEDNVVPIVVRPGHIRFEPFGKEDGDQAIPQFKISEINFQWNGITSKRKGQQWGKEKTAFPKRNDQKKENPECSDMLVNEEEEKEDQEKTTVDVPVDFDKLKPCSTLPQVGDTVAYRLVELSASWTPELSSFRVGKVSNYESKSDKITLIQVPEYPIVFEKRDEESEQPNVSLYAEDGSLEIDYWSLADVRIIKCDDANLNADKAKSVSNGVCQASSSKVIFKEKAKSAIPISDKAKSPVQGIGEEKAKSSIPISEKAKSPVQENGKVDVWDEICESLNAKKAQLSQENNWNKKKDSAGSTSKSSSWSSRSLRGSAVGPTMARLRAQKEL
ncbi:hypothetical protein F8388_014937 [Cannabis sativa]|uniref:Coilin n=1 Tax=Cannabis sativa TaxID=3483 RepID=A0A7J6F8M2_CANSA|nr:hypothetical protein F8388_014937 [Cannabis sativa]KAF4404947.1 hypothetical protein G4B88_006333 [Cannabis sativa]